MSFFFGPYKREGLTPIPREKKRTADRRVLARSVLSRNASRLITWLTRAVCVASTGSKLLPDFFLDVEDSSAAQEMIGAHKKSTESAPQGSPGGGVEGLFETMKSLCNEELVKSVNGVFEFHLEGKEPGVWYLDLKNDAGK